MSGEIRNQGRRRYSYSDTRHRYVIASGADISPTKLYQKFLSRVHSNTSSSRNPWLLLISSHTSEPSHSLLSKPKNVMITNSIWHIGSFIVWTIVLGSDLCLTSTITPHRILSRAPRLLTDLKHLDKQTIVPIDVKIMHSPILEVSYLQLLLTSKILYSLISFQHKYLL